MRWRNPHPFPLWEKLKQDMHKAQFFEALKPETPIFILTLTWFSTLSLAICCLFLRRTNPATTSVGTTSRSRKNSDKTRAMSPKEL